MTQTESNIDVLNLQDRHLSNHYISCRVKAQSSSAMPKIHQTLSYTLHGCSLNNRLGCLNGSFKQHPVSDSSLKALRRKKRHANNNEKNTVLTAPDSPSASQLFNLKQIPSSTLHLYYICCPHLKFNKSSGLLQLAHRSQATHDSQSPPCGGRSC